MISNLEDEIDILERHLEILELVVENEPIGIVKLSNETGYAHHEARYSLRVLEEEALIEPTSQGAITTEETDAFVADADDNLETIIATLSSMKFAADETTVEPTPTA